MTRSTWSLIAIVLLLGAVAYVMLQRPGEQSTSSAVTDLLASFDSAAITRIDVHFPGIQITVLKSSDGWMMVSPLSYRADKNVAQSVISQLHTMKISKPISTNPARFNVFKVDSTATLVRLTAGTNEVVALRLGKPNESYTDTYVRKESSNDVCLANGFFGLMVGRTPTDWRDKSIYPGDRGVIQKIAFAYGDTTFTLARNDSGWTIDGLKPNETSLKTWMNAFATFQADGFIDSAVSISVPPNAILTVDGTQIQFFQSPNAGSFLVHVSTQPQWFEVLEWRVSAILKRKMDFTAK